MKKSKFGILLLVLLSIATIYYLATTRRDNGLVLIGTVDANQVIVSAKIPGRIEKLMVDEGTTVKAGDLIAISTPPNWKRRSGRQKLRWRVPARGLASRNTPRSRPRATPRATCSARRLASNPHKRN